MRDKFTLSGGQSAKIEIAIGRNEGATTDVEWLCAGSNFKSVMSLARGEAELVLKPKPGPSGEVPIDPIVCIDRSVRPMYPNFLNQEYIGKPDFIALEKLGPAKFDASKLRQWLHSKQKKGGVVRGEVIHAELIKKKLIPSCLGLADLLGIQAKGVEFFRQHFKGKAVFGWRSVVPNRVGDLDVPYLVESDGGMVLLWDSLVYDWGATSPALRFA